MSEHTDFESKAINYYNSVLQKRRNYYLQNKQKSNEQSKLYHQKIMVTPLLRDNYLAKRRDIYNIKKQDKINNEKLELALNYN